MKNRDKTIDNLRGFAMIWVIFVHVLYWGNFFRNETIILLKSFCLFEMPLFFFVTGASNSFSKKDNYFSFILKRYKRILVPYWIFAIICAFLSIIYFRYSTGINFITAIKVLISWLIPINMQMTTLPYFTWALWFIPVYLCVVLVIPFLKAVKETRYEKPFSILLFLFFVIASYKRLGWIQNVIFYSFWVYLGLFYKEIKLNLRKHYFKIIIITTTICSFLSLVIFFYKGYPIDMQYNKFPPNIMFALFSNIMMVLILLSIPIINNLYIYFERNQIISKIANLFVTRSMTIFLYQIFAFNLTIPLSNLIFFGAGTLVAIFKSVFCLISTILICSLLALVFGNFEQFGSKNN